MGVAEVNYQILLVEDSEDDDLLIRRELNRQGISYEMTRVDELHQVSAALVEQEWSIILTDYNLTHFTAMEVIAAVHDSGKSFPIIIVSGAIGDEKAVELIKAGGDDYLLKDRLQRLGLAIEQAIRQKSLIREQELVTAKLEAIFDNTRDVILVVDADTGEILEANQAVQSMLGFELQEVIGQTCTIFCPPIENDLAEKLEQFVAEGTKKILSANISDARGNIWIMDIDISLIPWVSGQALLFTFHDVNEREKRTAAQRDADQLKLALQKERELNGWRSEIINTLSHEFRTPLTSIQIASNFLSSYYERLTPEKRLEYAEKLKEQSNFLLNILDEVSFADKHHLTISPDQLTRVELGQLIMEKIDEFQKELHTAVPIHFEHTGLPITYEVSAPLILRLLEELLENATKYTNYSKDVGVRLNTTVEQFEIAVMDYGIGIPEEDHQRIFEPFYRAKNVGTIRGMGLGLFNLKRIVELLQGEVELTSVLEQGTTFQIKIPAQGFIEAITNPMH